jgi:hypothetical protein
VEYLALHLEKSKTDLYDKGITLYTGHSKHVVCAVCAMKHNFCIQHSRQNFVRKSPLFGLSTGNPITCNELLNFTSHLLQSLGINPSLYSGHSYCIGGATTAALAGLSEL